ncbi:MAG: flagellar filament capping protein FliD [Oleiphilus sp.]
MANISSVGIGSGVLTSEVIENIANAERAPVEARLDNQEEGITAQLSLFGQIQSAVTDLRLPSRTLANPSLFESKSISSGNSAFSGVISGTATAGNYTLEVSNLAKSQTLTSGVFADKDTTTLGTGSLAISVDGVTANVTIDNTNNTLEGIAAAINEDASSLVTASVLDTGSGYKLVLNSNETGLENVIEVAVTDTGDGDNEDINGLSQLSYASGSLNLTQSQAATDAAFKFNGVDITRSSNTVSDLIAGVTLTLSGTNSGAPASLSITDDTTSVVEKVSEFVEKFNALQTLINDNSKFDPTGASENGLLLGDSTTRTIMNQVRRVLGTSVEGLTGASVQSLAEVGISTNFQTGLMTLDENILKTKLDASPSDVSALFSDQGRVTDGQITFETASLNTKPGTYDIEVTTAATRGELSGNVSLGASTTIDANNDAFTIKVDDTTSAEIILTAGSYTQAQLAAEIQSKINDDANLIAAGKTVTVTLDGSNQLVINSNIYGASSKVELTAVDTNTLTQLGLDVGVGTDGVDIVGKINGVDAVGSGQTLSAASDDDSEGIRLTVAGTATGSRGTVTYIEGVAEQMVDLITQFISVDGSISVKNDRLTKELALIDEDRAKLNERIETLTSRLARQFTAADIIISQLNSTQDFVSQQLAALAGTNNDK